MGRILVTISGKDIGRHLMASDEDFARALETMAAYSAGLVSDTANGIASYARRDDAKDITDFLRNLASKIEKAAG